MKVQFIPLTASLIQGCRAFNDRLRSHGKAPFFRQSNPARRRAGMRRYPKPSTIKPRQVELASRPGNIF